MSDGPRAGFDLATIGSGGAAFAAAIAAVDAGARVVMIEAGRLGGTCVNVGCVPSKALLAAAEARHAAGVASRFPGLGAANLAVDMDALIGGKDALVGQLRAQKYGDLAADYGWQIMSGTAAFTGDPDRPALDVALNTGDTTSVIADQYLIATGATPWAPPVDGLSAAGYLTSTTALELVTLPASMIVLGAGAAGLELAQLFARLGTKVTLLEACERLAPSEEAEIGAGIQAILQEEGITAHTGVDVIRARRGRTGHTLTLASGEQLHADAVLVATGRRPTTSGLNLDAAGVATGDRGQIVVDDRQHTSNPRIWAAGDVTGAPQFVYVAAAQGSLAADNALTGADRALDYSALPRVTFTSPAIASVGLTDAQAVAAGLRCDCRTLPLDYLPRALVNRDTRGLVKIVADADTGRLLGVHALARDAGELITAAGYALTSGMTVHQLAQSWTPYLTTAEALRLAAQTYTRDVARLSCCAA